MFLFPNNDYLVYIWPTKKYVMDVIQNHQMLENIFLYGSGLGNNIFALKGFILDPFNWLFLGSSSNRLIIWQYLFKLFILYMLTYKILFLRTSKKTLSGIFSIFFAFNGMFIFWSTQDTHFTAMVLIILQWYGYELYRNTGSVKYFILLSLPLFMFSSIYWVITFNIFFTGFIILDSVWGVESHFYQRKSLFFSKIINAYIIIVLICTWSILPELWVLAHNGRVNIGAHTQSLLHIKLITQFGTIGPLELYNLKLYAQFILRGFGNYTIPLDKIWVSIFSGPLWYDSIFLLASAVAYIKSEITFNKKVLYNLILTVGLLLLFFPFVVLIFNGMSDVRMRWSWFLLIPLLICAVKYWAKTPNLRNFRISLITLAIIFFIAAFYAYCKGDLYFTDKLVLFTYVEISICFVLLFSLSFLRKYVFLSLVIVGLADLLFQNYIFINISKPVVDHIVEEKYFNDNTTAAVEHIRQQDHSLFYRMDKTYSSMYLCNYCGLNENMLQGYDGVKSYVSTPNPAYFSFSKDMDARPYYNFIFGFDKRYDILRMLSVKYIMSREEEDMPGYTLHEKFRDIYIYVANNYHGIGQVFHNYVSQAQFKQITAIKDRVFSRCLILPDHLINNQLLGNTALQNCLNLPSVLDNQKEEFYLEKLTGNVVSGTANLKKPGVLFLAIPFDDGFSAKIDGRPQKVLNVGGGFVGIDLSAGRHHIVMQYMPPLLELGLIVSGVTVIMLVSLFIFQRKK